MFEQKKEKATPKFMYDLELEIKDNPARGKELLEKAMSRAQEVKMALREGVNENDFDNLGLLLHGYTALQKVLKKISA